MSRIRRKFENAWTNKADHEWDMAGEARKDGDKEAEQEHMNKAREYEKLAHEMIKDFLEKI